MTESPEIAEIADSARSHGDAETNRVDAECSLRASFSFAGSRWAPQVGVIRHAGALLDQRDAA